MDKPTVVIVGGGLAGLSAAYELSKTNSFDITILESSNRLGGRVYTTQVDGTPVDLGAFMIFPWYKHMRILIKELGLASMLRRSGSKAQAYQLKDGSSYRYEPKTPMTKMLDPKLTKDLVRMLLARKISFYEPVLDTSTGDTLGSLFDGHPQQQELMEMMLRGYTYAESHALPVATYVGFAYKLLLSGGFDRVDYLSTGTGAVVDGLVATLKQSGCDINLDTEVIDISKNLVVTPHRKYRADSIIVATSNALPRETRAIKDIPHTTFQAIAFTTSLPITVSGEANWMVLYNQPDEKIKSVGNLKCSMRLNSDLYICYLETNKALRKAELDNAVGELLSKISPGNGFEVVADNFWERTMPITNLATLKRLRETQGKDGIYFAGDYLGAPSMETAVYTGKSAAQKVIQALGATR